MRIVPLIILIAAIVAPANLALPGALAWAVGLPVEAADACCDGRPPGSGAERPPQPQDDCRGGGVACHAGCCGIHAAPAGVVRGPVGTSDVGPLALPIAASFSRERRDPLLRPPQILV